MAKKTLLKIEDDLDGSPEAEPITFALNGRTFEIDLSLANKAKLHSALAPYVAAGRVVRRKHRADTQLSPQQLREIRGWAVAEGIDVGARGRVPRRVLEAYNASI